MCCKDSIAPRPTRLSALLRWRLSAPMAAVIIAALLANAYVTNAERERELTWALTITTLQAQGNLR